MGIFCSEKLGLKEKAWMILNDVLKIDPGFQEAKDELVNIGVSFTKKWEYDQAYKALMDVFSLDKRSGADQLVALSVLCS
jgi:hypothetical protein